MIIPVKCYKYRKQMPLYRNNAENFVTFLSSLPSTQVVVVWVEKNRVHLVYTFAY